METSQQGILNTLLYKESIKMSLLKHYSSQVKMLKDNLILVMKKYFVT